MMQLQALREHNSVRLSTQPSSDNGGEAPGSSDGGEEDAPPPWNPPSAGPESGAVEAIPTPQREANSNKDQIHVSGTPMKDGVDKEGPAEMLPVLREPTESDLASMSEEERNAFVAKRRMDIQAERMAAELAAQNVALDLTPQEIQRLTPAQVESRNKKKWFRYKSTWNNFVSSFRQSKALQNFLDREPHDKESDEHAKWVLATYVGHPYVTMFITALVVVNSSLTGLYADQRIGEESFRTLIFIFLSIFTVEIGLKIYAFGSGRYLSDGWNVLDLTVVSAAIVEVVITYVGPLIGFESATVTSALRIMGIFRISRLFAALKELEFVTRAFVLSMGGAFWVNVLTLLSLFILSLLGRLTFGEHDGLKTMTAYHPHGSGANGSELFGSVFRGMATMFQVNANSGRLCLRPTRNCSRLTLTLFQVMCMNWAVPTRIVSEYHPFGWAFFTFSVSFLGLGVFNLYTAIYVEKMREITEATAAKAELKRLDRRKELMLEVGDLMNVIDTDRSGTLDRLEMEEGVTLLKSTVESIKNNGPMSDEAKAMPCLTGDTEFNFSMDHIYLAFEKYQLSNMGEELDVPYRDVIETVFTMHDPLTRNEVAVMHGEIEDRLEKNSELIMRADTMLDDVIAKLKDAVKCV